MRGIRATTETVPSHRLEVLFRDTLLQCPNLIPRGSRVLVALSGGLDSTALLHLLLRVRDGLDLQIKAAHFDHGVQAGSSVLAEQVVEQCDAVGVACVVTRAKELAGGQAAYRKARYDFLRSEAVRLDATRVALAHQSDDYLETVVLRLIRGTGIRGLAGIPIRRDLFVRPLLSLRRDILRAYLVERGLGWLEDPANVDPRYTRVRVRQEVLPRLRAAGGMKVFDELLSQLAADALCVDCSLDARAEGHLSSLRITMGSAALGAQIAHSKVREYGRADQARILRSIARDMGFRLRRRGTGAGVEFMNHGASGQGVDVAGGLRVSREYDVIRVGPATVEVNIDRELEICSLSGIERIKLDGREYEVRWGSLSGREACVAEVPMGQLHFPLRMRGPRPGDSIRTHAGSRKLKKLLNERRVPRSERSRVPVLVGADQQVLWVAGHGIVSCDRSNLEEKMFRIEVGEY
jgi:tRNA(Ile)-lysidine synthase